MMKKKFIFIFFIFFFNLLITPFSYADNASNGIGVDLNVVVCNNNNVCDIAENFMSCPLDCVPPTPTPTPAPVSTNKVINILDFFKNLTVEPSYTNANIKWNSNSPSIYIIKWGTTSENKDGTLKNIHFTYDHSVDLTNLEPSKTYYFSIESDNYAGFKQIISNQSFTTLTPVDKIAPANVTNAKISTTASGIVLSWTNPDDKDFSYIRVVRTLDKYTTDPYGGKLVYEGSGQYMRDANVEIGTKYFYTIFTRDVSGNFSSGYPISIVHNPPSDGIAKIDKEITDTKVLTGTQGINYLISQNNIKQDFKLGGTYEIDGNSNFKIISLFKTQDQNVLWVEVRDMNMVVVGRYFFDKFDVNFLSREVVLPPIKGNGYYAVSIYRYMNGEEQLIHQAGINVTTIPLKVSKKISWTCFIWWLILFIILIIIIFLILRRKKRKKEALKQKENNTIIT